MSAVSNSIKQPGSRKVGGMAFAPSHSTIKTATCAQMVRSKLNVRRKGGDDLAELMALIRAQGLLQNLVGFAQRAAGQPSGVIEVVAGGRRLACVGRLIEAGELPDDYQIPYLLVSEEEGVAISLAENSGREPMHAADVFDAMAELARRGTSIADIGIAFGVEALTVRRRLKLANVAPRFMQMYREDQIRFEQMVALAISDDHGAQEQAWDSLDQWSRDPYRLRRMLTAQQVDVQSDRVARFVGLDAYAKAGGLVTRDLFSESGAGYIDDVALVDSLAAAKLADAANSLAQEGHAWVTTRVRIDAAELATFGIARVVPRVPTDAERAALDAAASEQCDLETLIDQTSNEEGDTDPLYAQLDALERDRRALQETLRETHAADRAIAGALVTIDEHGKLSIRRGLIRPDDRSKMDKLPGVDQAEKDGKERAVHSARLMTLLTGHRTAALHAEMMARPDIALVVLAHGLITQVFTCRHRVQPLAQLRLEQPVLVDEVVNGAAGLAIAARRKALQERLPQEVDDGLGLMGWLLVQPHTMILEFIAFCVGSSLNAVQSVESPAPAFSGLAHALKLDMNNWWSATAASYFSHVSRARITSVVVEALSAEAAVPIEAMRKGAAAEAAERMLADLRWLPAVLQAPM